MPREMIRQGGRSARIQKEVHGAVRALLGEMERSALTVPLIAERAGVTPSTIYRRWGDLGALLADVAVEQLRPIADPDDTGSTSGDLRAYLLQYAEEMGSKPGREMLRDVLGEVGSDVAAVKCCQYTYDHLEAISARAVARGETPLDVPRLVDRMIAPVIYHILFGDRAVTEAYCLELLGTLPVTLRPAA